MIKKIHTLIQTYRERDLAGFFRFLLLWEKEKRTSITGKYLSNYYRQILLEKCDHIGPGLHVGPRPIEISKGEDCNIILGKNVKIYGPCQLVAVNHVGHKSSIKIGDNTHIGRYSSIRALQSIEIGNNCLLARYVRIIDNNGHPIQPGPRMHREKIPEKEVRPIKIEDNVWIGENSFIMPGVTIGYGSIIGANSVVKKDIPDHKIAIGNPARVIGWLTKEKEDSTHG